LIAIPGLLLLIKFAPWAQEAAEPVQATAT
jgi:hypothetical protein